MHRANNIVKRILFLLFLSGCYFAHQSKAQSVYVAGFENNFYNDVNVSVARYWKDGTPVSGDTGFDPNAPLDMVGGGLLPPSGMRKGGAVKGKRMAAGGMAYTKGKPGTPAHRPVAGSPFSKGKPGTSAHRPVAGGPAGPRAMRGGGLARKGVGMALAKGGLAKRAGGCAKRGVGRGKMV